MATRKKKLAEKEEEEVHAPFREALEFLLGTKAPEYVTPHGEDLNEYADKLQDWCSERLAYLSGKQAKFIAAKGRSPKKVVDARYTEATHWMTALSVIEAAQVIVGGAIENANIPRPETHRELHDALVVVNVENARLQAQLKEARRFAPNPFLAIEMKRLDAHATITCLIQPDGYVSFARVTKDGRDAISTWVPLDVAFEVFDSLEDGAGARALWIRLTIWKDDVS